MVIVQYIYSCFLEEHGLRMFENKVLTTTKFRLTETSNRRMEKIRLHDEELHNFYSSPNIITVMKSRNVTWAEHAARM
jgi:hypothetical protein